MRSGEPYAVVLAPSAHRLYKKFDSALQDRIKQEARNLFVHQFREEHEWPMLGPLDRVREPLVQEILEEEDPLVWEVRKVEQASDLDRYAAGMLDELSRTLEQTRVFRQELFQVLADRRGED